MRSRPGSGSATDDPYRVNFNRRAERELSRQPKAVADRIIEIATILEKEQCLGRPTTWLESRGAKIPTGYASAT